MNKIEGFIKRFEMIFVLILATFLFYFGMTFLLVGKNIYGSDATLLWASGILTYMGIRGFAVIISFIINKKNANHNLNEKEVDKK